MRILGSVVLSVALSYAVYILFTADMLTIGYDHRFYFLMSSLNLIIHEAGHFLFLPVQMLTKGQGWGQFLYLFGGSLLQWSVPALLALYFLYRREILGVSVMLFWLGQSFYDSVHYIKDAVALQIDLMVGSIHDWNYLLFEIGVLHRSEEIAHAVLILGLTIATTGVLLSWMYFIREIYALYVSESSSTKTHNLKTPRHHS